MVCNMLLLYIWARHYLVDPKAAHCPKLNPSLSFVVDPGKGTRNDESSLKPKGRANQLGDRLILHSIRDSHGRVLGLGAPTIMDNGDEDENTDHEARGWEAFMEAQTAHEGAVTGMDMVGGFGDLGGVSGVATSGGDGWGEIDGRGLRLPQLFFRPLKSNLNMHIVYDINCTTTPP